MKHVTLYEEQHKKPFKIHGEPVTDIINNQWKLHKENKEQEKKAKVRNTHWHWDMYINFLWWWTLLWWIGLSLRDFAVSIFKAKWLTTDFVLVSIVWTMGVWKTRVFWLVDLEVWVTNGSQHLDIGNPFHGHCICTGGWYGWVMKQTMESSNHYISVELLCHWLGWAFPWPLHHLHRRKSGKICLLLHHRFVIQKVNTWVSIIQCEIWSGVYLQNVRGHMGRVQTKDSWSHDWFYHFVHTYNGVFLYISIIHHPGSRSCIWLC